MVRVRRHLQSHLARTNSEPSEHADRCRGRWAGCRACTHDPCGLGPHQWPPCSSNRCLAEDAKDLLDRLPENHCEYAKDQHVPELGIGRGSRGCAPPKNSRSQDHDKGMICAHVTAYNCRACRALARDSATASCAAADLVLVLF